ncbi:hypothetical protein PV327_002841 [Microctonus hyperodae]|uniref:39S ribosomal protein L1, mitochondrial n=1 Tax=Microctonus hyperodae TaxID=165561 RepID=A0AA39FGD2_MICHY|nr:hypothetical protein PV327_002841 [Microctonus hyperodae]
MAATAGKQLGTLAAAFYHHQKLNLHCYQLCSLLQVRNYAARKGTREKARKKKVKVEVKKVGWTPHNQKKKSESLSMAVLNPNDSWKVSPIDDVWLGKYHKWKVYPFAEAVECHRETHHPTCYNLPNAFINAYIELDMHGEKPTKMVEAFTRTVNMPHVFDHGENRTVIAFAKTPELLQMADKAGATICGDGQLIKKIQKGEISVSDFTATVAHPEIMAELSVIRGLMKRKFPNPRVGTLGLDLSVMIRKILYGIQYKAVPYEDHPSIGRITVPIGRLTMDTKQLEENFITVIKDVEQVRPKRDGLFITRTSLRSPPSPEMLKVDFQQYFEEKNSADASYESDDDEEIVRSNVI